jgi:hypothetical protein
MSNLKKWYSNKYLNDSGSITKAEVLKMAYYVCRAHDLGFFINYFDEWSLENEIYCYEGNGFRDLFKKCKELLK